MGMRMGALAAAFLFVAASLDFGAVYAQKGESGGTGEKVYRYIPHTGEAELWDTSIKTIPPGAPDAVITSNNLTWNVYYMDVRNSTGIGFDGPQGAAAQNMVDRVLTYVADVLNVSATLDVLVQESTNDPNSDTLASAGTYFSSVETCHPGATQFRVVNGAKQFSGTEEIFVNWNFGHPWHFTSGTAPSQQFDAATVFLHEILHGLGFFSLIRPGGTGFDGENVFMRFDQFIQRESTQNALVDCSAPAFSGNVADITSNNLTFSGPNAAAMYDQGGVRPGIFAPNPHIPGSSLSHWDTGNIVGGAVMEHAIPPGVMKRTLRPVDLGALIDIGYTSAAEPGEGGGGLPGCPGVVQDPSFEDGTPNTFWGEASTNFGSPICNFAECDISGARTGEFWVWLGGVDSFEQGSVEQDVTIADADTAALRFFLRIPQAGGAAAAFNVLLGGNVIFSATEADQANFNFYKEVLLDVSAFADGTGRTLRFEAETSDETSFFVDDVCLVTSEDGDLNFQPSITILGDNPITVECGDPYVDPGATAADVEDGDLTGSITVSGLPLDTSNVGTFQITYSVTDSGGLTDQKTREVVVVDTTPPVISLNGGDLEIECGSGAFADPGFSATDNCDGNITGAVVFGGDTVNTSVPGVYTISYIVQDTNGNPAQAVRTVVVLDSTPPLITLVGGDVTIECGAGTFTDHGFGALDSCEGNLTGAVVIGGDTVDPTTPGVYHITYTVVDSSGNVAETVRTVTITDEAGPVITLLGDNPQLIQQNTPYVELGATAVDTCEGDLSGSVVVNASQVNTATPGTYQVTYDAQDSQGNNAVRRIRTVQVVCGGAPAPPTGVNASTNNPSHVTISWDPVLGTGIRYQVFRDGSAVSDIITATTFNDTTASTPAVIESGSGCAAQTTVTPREHQYTVRARNDCDEISATSAPAIGSRSGGAKTAVAELGILGATLLLLGAAGTKRRKW